MLITRRHHSCLVLLAVIWVGSSCVRIAMAEEMPMQNTKKRPFIGEKTLVMKECPSQRCYQQCQQECKAMTGANCEWYWDICQRCLQQYPDSVKEEQKQYYSNIWWEGPTCLGKHPEMTNGKCTFSLGKWSENTQQPISENVECYLTCR